MTLNEYQKLAMRTNDKKATDRLFDKMEVVDTFNKTPSMTSKPYGNYDLGGIIDGCFGLSGEVGEFNDLVKKWIFHGHPLDEEHAKKECGDIFWYLAMICESFGWSVDDICQININKLRARYPSGFSIEKSEHRAEGDI